MPPMPPLPLPDDDIKAIAAYIHSVTAKAAGQGGPPPGPPVVLNIVVGDAAAGQQLLRGELRELPLGHRRPAAGWPRDTPIRCSCRTPGSAAGRRAAAARRRPRRRLPARRAPEAGDRRGDAADGQRVEGRLDRIDDFIVILTQADGTQRTFRRNGDVPQCRSPIRSTGTRSCW